VAVVFVRAGATLNDETAGVSHKPIAHVLLRAPLLPVAALASPARALEDHPLGRIAVALASPDLDRARHDEGGLGADARAALGRYARRAAFRPTPAGLLAGVAGAELGTQTRIEVGEPWPHIDVSWGRLWALGRALLEDPPVRNQVRLRQAPSLLRTGDALIWLALERDCVSERAASVDDPLGVVLAATATFAPWSRVRRQLAAALAGAGGSDDEDLDLFLLDLVDQGLLVHDLTPPLVGDPPAAWMVARLGRGRNAAMRSAGEQLQAVRALAAREQVSAARQLLATLPGAEEAPRPDLTAMLSFEDRSASASASSVLDAGVVERAAALAPLLFRLQQALAAPVAERALDVEGRARLEGIAELFGAGAYDLSALATGAFGVVPSDGEEPPPALLPPPAPLSAYLCQLLVAAAAEGRQEIHLSPAILEPMLPPLDPPPSFELILAPAAAPPAEREGSGWMIGLHGPAGASLGRFAHRQGSPAARTLAALAAAELELAGGPEVLDVVSVASAALADLGVHPPVRARGLALAGWPAGHAVTPAQLQVVASEAAPDSLALRHQRGAAVFPAPLHRVRSTTLPPGLYRLLGGWSLLRQHTPWAFPWGLFGDLPFLPRVVLDGFVVAPASWGLPGADELARPSAIADWRRRARVPRMVQVGDGDELLPVDLDDPGAAEELRRAGGRRAFEIWPPLDRLVDAGGRRVEAVVALVAAPEALRSVQAALTRRAGRVAPPCEAGPAPDWRTVRVYGPEQGQDAVLAEAVAPLVQGEAGRALRRWFFIRYRDPASGRPHLRVRFCATTEVVLARFGRLLERALLRLRGSGLVVTLERAEYFPETARYGGEQSMEAVEAIFQAGSELTLAALAPLDHEGAPVSEALAGDPRTLFVRAADGLARGLGLDLGQRRQLAERRRLALADVAGGEDPGWKLQFRELGRELAARLSGSGDGARRDGATAALATFEKRVRAASARGGRGGKAGKAAKATGLRAALPALLHTQAVRMLGTRVEDEQASYVFWSRALEATAARARRGGG
jgi:lantibiotic biosynthesis protein